MEIVMNGKTTAVAEPCTVMELLVQRGFGTERVVVERNGVILTPESWSETVLCAKDKLEIVTFVGGG